LRLSELAILVIARHWSQQVEWAIHAPIAKAQGLSAALIDDIAHGRRPAAMSDDEAAVHDFCTELLRKQTVGDANWARAVQRFGEQGAVDLLGIAGYYSFLAMVMNAARTAVPDSAAEPLPPL